MPRKKITPANEAAAHRKHKEYVGEYQKRMYSLGKRGRLAALLNTMGKRIDRYIEDSEAWDLREEDIEALQFISDELDVLALRLGGESQ